MMESLKELPTSLFFKAGEQSPYPKIVCAGLEFRGDYQIVMEGELLCQCKELTDAIALLFASFYLFNISFPKGLSSTLKFITRYFFNIADTTISDAKVARLALALF